MKQEFFAYAYSKTKNDLLSEVSAKILYLTQVCKYKSKKKNKAVVQIDNPLDIISNVYPKPAYTLDIHNEPTDECIDISVIMPIYNYVDYISISIDSVLNQKTKYSFELILVDDGSTDGASYICDSYQGKDTRVRVIHQKNGGIGAARNTGLNNAKGKYIMFVDCDDYVHDDFIEMMLDEAYKTDVDVVICGYTLIKKKGGETLSEREILYSGKNIEGYKDSEDLIMNYQGLPWNKIYNRSVFDNIRYIPGFWYEDTIIHFLVFRTCKSFSYIKKSLYDYMWYEKNFSHTQAKVQPKSLERYWLLEVMQSESKRAGLPIDKGFYKVLLRHSGALLYSGVNGMEEDVVTAAFVLCSDLIEKYKPNEKYNLTFFERELEESLLKKDISRWKEISKYI